MKSTLQSAGRFCVRHSETILSVLIFAASFLKAVVESERRSRR
jgi:hypothetical protein